MRRRATSGWSGLVRESHGAIEVTGRQGRGPLTSHDAERARRGAGARPRAGTAARDAGGARGARRRRLSRRHLRRGGYSRAILAAGAGRVFAIDRDPAAVARGRELARSWPNFTMLEGCFGDMAELLGGRGVVRGSTAWCSISASPPSSSTTAARGFSFTLDGPLDMRMSGAGITAAEVVNRADRGDACRHLVPLRRGAARRGASPGRSSSAGSAGRSSARTSSPTLVAGVVGGRPGRIDPATRTFQALRIHVNDELGELERALPRPRRCSRPGGRLVVVAFHSLEDRLVKRFLARAQRRRAAPVAPPADGRDSAAAALCGSRPGARCGPGRPRSQPTRGRARARLRCG